MSRPGQLQAYNISTTSEEEPVLFSIRTRKEPSSNILNGF